MIKVHGSAASRGMRDGTPVTAMLSPKMSDCSMAI
jgi:hypothetical protein